MKKQIKICTVIIEGCDNHPNGCYIRFKSKPAKLMTSETRDDCVLDYDNDMNLIGIEFYNGLSKLGEQGK